MQQPPGPCMFLTPHAGCWAGIGTMAAQTGRLAGQHKLSGAGTAVAGVSLPRRVPGGASPASSSAPTAPSCRLSPPCAWPHTASPCAVEGCLAHLAGPGAPRTRPSSAVPACQAARRPHPHPELPSKGPRSAAAGCPPPRGTCCGPGTRVACSPRQGAWRSTCPAQAHYA